MLSVQTIARRVRQRLHDMDRITYDDEEILDCVNYGIRFIRRIIAKFRPALLMSESEGTLTAGTKSVTLEQRPLKIVSVTIGDDNKPLHETDIAFAIHERGADKEPKGFYLTGTQTINFFPSPITPTKYKICTVDDIEEIGLNDNSPLLSEFDDFLIDYATIRLSVGNEYDMTQETELIANIVAQIQQSIMPPPASIQIRGYWQ